MGDKPVILIVDDDAYTVRLVELILKRNTDWDVVTASNGKAGIEAAREHLPDLILLDISMPEIDGYKACETIKQDDNFRETPIVFLTQMSDKQDVVQGFSMGAVDFISKPFYPQELIARLQVHVQVRLQKKIIGQQLSENQELLQVLCHDLANPLGAISGVLQMSDRDISMLEKFKSIMDSSVNNMIEMISLVRKFRAMNDGKHRIRLSPVCLGMALAESIQTLNHRLVEKQVTVQSTVPDNTLVMADKTSLVNSVLNNLITNAIKFSFPGDEIRISVEDAGQDRCVLRIRDNGIGMPPRILQSLFSMNIPTSRPGTNRESGTGYGMPLVRKFMLQYNGDIRVESVEKTPSSPVHGTTVLLTLQKANDA